MVRSAILQLVRSQSRRTFSASRFSHPGHQHYRASLHHQNARLQLCFYSVVTGQRRSWSSRAQEDSNRILNETHKDESFCPLSPTRQDVTVGCPADSFSMQALRYQLPTRRTKVLQLSDKLFAVVSSRSLNRKWEKKRDEAFTTCEKWKNGEVDGFETAMKLKIEFGELLQLLKDDQQFVSELKPECRLDEEVLQEYQEILAGLTKETEEMLELLR